MNLYCLGIYLTLLCIGKILKWNNNIVYLDIETIPKSANKRHALHVLKHELQNKLRASNQNSNMSIIDHKSQKQYYTDWDQNMHDRFPCSFSLGRNKAVSSKNCMAKS